MDATKALRGMAFVCRCTKHLNPPGLASLFVQSRAYQTSVTLPAIVEDWPLWIRIVSALATRMSTVWAASMYTMWTARPLTPLVMVEGLPLNDSKPTHAMKLLGLCNRLT